MSLMAYKWKIILLIDGINWFWSVAIFVSSIDLPVAWVLVYAMPKRRRNGCLCESMRVCVCVSVCGLRLSDQKCTMAFGNNGEISLQILVVGNIASHHKPVTSDRDNVKIN